MGMRRQLQHQVGEARTARTCAVDLAAQRATEHSRSGARNQSQRLTRVFLLMCLVALPFRPPAATAQTDTEMAPAEPIRQLVEVRFRPAPNAQLAVWLESADGEFLKTLALTEATALRGIGNRPGASQMNSGFRWPYGRREGVLPTWARRRASQAGAEKFRRVIFQKRKAEGLASRTSPDFSADDYFCLSFEKDRSRADALDAVSCATVFSSDKGRFITEDDVARSYWEPFEDPATGLGRRAELPLHSLYPPRRDVTYGGELQVHPDVGQYRDHARQVMPDIDEVTMATPPGDRTRSMLAVIPSSWQGGDYRVCVEANVEGDHNSTFSTAHYPTPRSPEVGWDSWAIDYGYPYRGQPSVTYCVDFKLTSEGRAAVGTDKALGSVLSWDTTDPTYGTLAGLDGLTDDPGGSPGQGIDRLRVMPSGYRLEVEVRSATGCAGNAPPGPVGSIRASQHSDELHAHEWMNMHFEAAQDDDGIFRYDVRYSTEPIDSDAGFMQATPAKAASVQAEELFVPTAIEPGAMIRVQVGGLNADETYYIAVRAVDHCANTGPVMTARYETPSRVFTTVTPCFIASATYGSPLAHQIGPLRRFRDRFLLSHGPGRALVRAYYELGPSAARAVTANASLKSIAQTVLDPIVSAVSWVTGHRG